MGAGKLTLPQTICLLGRCLDSEVELTLGAGVLVSWLQGYEHGITGTIIYLLSLMAGRRADPASPLLLHTALWRADPASHLGSRSELALDVGL